MSETNAEQPGLIHSLKRLSHTVAAVAQNRIELLLVELQEERSRLVGMLILAAAGAVCGLMALIVLTFTLVLVSGDQSRIAVLVGLGSAYLAGAGLAFWKLNTQLKSWEAFSATLAELRKDRAWLEEQSDSACDSASRH